MRSLRIPVLVLLTVIFVLLFFSDFLTGREHLEYQDAYSRTGHLIERKYGFSWDSGPIPNAMSEYYRKELNPGQKEFHWVTAPDSYHVDRFTLSRVKDSAPIPPITDLAPQDELAFLRILPNNKVRLAVIHSLYRERSGKDDPASQKKDNALASEEAGRVASIKVWLQYDYLDHTPAVWWKAKSTLFGLTPEGEPLPAPPPAPGNVTTKKTGP